MRWAADRLDPNAYASPGIDLPVFYGDLDTNRHVNNVAVGRYFEQARFETHRAVGLNGAAHDDGGRLLVARVAIDYVAEIHYGVAPLHLRLRITALGNSSLTEEQAAWQGDTCVALAEVVAAYRHGDDAAPLPAAMRSLLDELRGPGRA